MDQRLLQELLNASPEWRARVGGKITRVINLGVDGFGMVQFAAMVRHHAAAFDPDEVIVNFISDDILRRRRRFLAPSTADDHQHYVRTYVTTHILDHMDWFTLHSQLLFAITYGRRRGQQPELPWDARDLLGSAGPYNKFASRDDALTASSAAVRDILSLYPGALFLQENARTLGGT